MLDFSAAATPLAALAAVVAAGALAGLSPCSLPTVLLVAGYTGGAGAGTKSTINRALAFIAGIVISLTALGVAAGSIGMFMGDSRFLDYLVAAIFVVMGLWLVGVIRLDAVGGLSGPKPARGSGVAGAFLLGIPFGVAASPCTLPITAAVLAYASGTGQPGFAGGLLASFAVARSIPLLVVAFGASFIARLQSFDRWREWIERVVGAALIVMGLLTAWTA